MKTASARPISTWLTASAAFLLLGIVSLLALTGCGKKTTPPPSTSSTASAVTPATPPVASQPIYAAQVVSAPAISPAADGGADLKQLNHFYIGWIMQSHQRVKTFEEFVSASGVQVPPAPSGKKYVIDGNGFINLANR